MYVSDRSAYLRGDLSPSALRWMCPASSLRSLYNILVVHRHARAILQLHGPTATAIVCFKNALATIEVCTSNEAVQHDNRSDHGTMWICNGRFHCRSLACGTAGGSCKGPFLFLNISRSGGSTQSSWREAVSIMTLFWDTSLICLG